MLKNRKLNMQDTKLFGTVNLKAGEAIGHSIDSVQFIQSGKIVAVRFNTQNYENEVELQLDDYEIEIRDGKYYAVRKKLTYPSNYLECREILGESAYYGFSVYTTLQNLIICRNAYWKIYGEEMGLGKPWEPDWNDQRPKYTITVIGNQLIKHHTLSQNYILAFPTEEMRDAFYENFKKEIEQCKELL